MFIRAEYASLETQGLFLAARNVPMCLIRVGRRTWTPDSVDHILQWNVRTHALVGRPQKLFPISAPVWPIFVTRKVCSMTCIDDQAGWWDIPP
jgi:hypothetical protein